MRSTEVQICPLLLKAPTAACPAAQCGVDVVVHQQRIISAVFPDHVRAAKQRTARDPGTGGAGTDVRHNGHPACSVSWVPTGAPPVSVMQDIGREGGRQDLSEQDSEVRAAFAGLVHHGVAGHQGRADQAAGHCHGVIPGGQQDGDAAGFGNGVVRGQRVAAKAMTAVDGSEFRILLQRGDAGSYAGRCFVCRAAGFPAVHVGEFGGGGGQRPRGGSAGSCPSPRGPSRTSRGARRGRR